MKAWLNGLIIDTHQPAIALNDRGLLLGDGFFTTIYYDGQQFECLCGHRQRLQDSGEIFGIALSNYLTDLEKVCQQLLAANDLHHAPAALRVTITRGPGERGVLPPPPQSTQPTVLITVAPYQRPQKVIRLKVSKYIWTAVPPLSTVKHLGYQLQILGRLEAQEAGVDDVIFANKDGDIVCTTTANIFVNNAGQWNTPPLTSGALPGLMRRRLLTEMPAIQVRPIPVASLNKGIDALMVTNSLIGRQKATLV